MGSRTGFAGPGQFARSALLGSFRRGLVGGGLSRQDGVAVRLFLPDALTGTEQLDGVRGGARRADVALERGQRGADEAQAGVHGVVRPALDLVTSLGDCNERGLLTARVWLFA